MRMIRIALVVACLLMLASPALAGSSRAEGEPTFTVEEVAKLAKKFERSLAERGARVAIVARVGRPKSELPEGVSYTHTAFAVYSLVTTTDGRKVPGYAIYNLYQRNDELDRSDLVMDYPLDFFWGVQELEAGVTIPTPKLQEKLLKTIASDTYRELHNPEYSVLANPFTLKYQNCTEHALDVIVASIYETNSLELIKANERAYFDPQPITVNKLKLFFGSMLISDVAISDHKGQPKTTTYTTIGKFLEKYNLVQEQYVVSLD